MKHVHKMATFKMKEEEQSEDLIYKDIWMPTQEVDFTFYQESRNDHAADWLFWMNCRIDYIQQVDTCNDNFKLLELIPTTHKKLDNADDKKLNYLLLAMN